MSDIFLSYASQDRERVRLLASALEAHGWSVFWDRVIPVGMRWHDVLGYELDNCQCVLVVWSHASIRSQWVYEEAEEGKRKGVLFPVKVDNVLPPLGFRTFQGANLCGWQGELDYPTLMQLTQDIEAHFTQLRHKIEAEHLPAEAARKAEAEHIAPTRKNEEEHLAAIAADVERNNATTEVLNTHLFKALLKKANYDIIDKLGEGGMATVYLARHTLLKRDVALKVMSPRIATTEAFRQRFIRETRTLTKLEHPHIVRIYDGGADNDLFYMAMELLPGETLKGRLANGALPPKVAVAITRQIASALSYAHEKRYIHRDIKPANILFRANGDAALADFGIAKLQSIISNMTPSGLVTETPYYLSPEQSTGSSIDQRSDLYSLGIVFYEMLTGKRPFVGNTPMNIAYQHLNAPIPRLSGEASRFQPLLDRLLAKNPDNRFTSAAEVLQALAIPPIPSLPEPTKVIRPASIPSPSHTGIWLTGIAVMASLGGVGYYAVDTQHQTKIQEQAKLQEAQKQRQEQVSNHLELARIRGEKQRIFDYTAWSNGCKMLLEDTDGSYDAQDSAEWHYRQVQALDSSNAVATWELEKLENRQKVKFSDCDNYQRAK